MLLGAGLADHYRVKPWIKVSPDNRAGVGDDHSLPPWEVPAIVKDYLQLVKVATAFLKPSPKLIRLKLFRVLS